MTDPHFKFYWVKIFWASNWYFNRSNYVFEETLWILNLLQFFVSFAKKFDLGFTLWHYFCNMYQNEQINTVYYQKKLPNRKPEISLKNFTLTDYPLMTMDLPILCLVFTDIGIILSLTFISNYHYIHYTSQNHLKLGI